MKSVLVILGGIGLFIGIPVVSVALGIITLPWLKLTTQVKTNQDIITKTYNADNVIYNYHWFQERLGSIKALETQISNAQDELKRFETNAGPRKEWTFEDKNEDSRLGSIVLGLKNEYKSQVEEYNARASESDRSIFQTDLPLFFSLKPF